MVFLFPKNPKKTNFFIEWWITALPLADILTPQCGWRQPVFYLVQSLIVDDNSLFFWFLGGGGLGWTLALQMAVLVKVVLYTVLYFERIFFLKLDIRCSRYRHQFYCTVFTLYEVYQSSQKKGGGIRNCKEKEMNKRTKIVIVQELGGCTPRNPEGSKFLLHRL